MAGVVAGATTIVAVDLHQHRLALALELGATHVLEGDDPEIVAKIQSITSGGADYALDTTGVPSVITAALAGLRLTGVLGMVGVQRGNLVLDGLALLGKTATGILEGSVDPHLFIPQLIDLWRAGRFPFDRLIEHFPLSDINAAERSSRSGNTIKPVLVPNGAAMPSSHNDATERRVRP